MSTTTHESTPRYTAPGFDNPDTRPIDTGTPNPDTDPAQQATQTPDNDPSTPVSVFADVDPAVFTVDKFSTDSIATIYKGLTEVMPSDASVMVALKDIHDTMATNGQPEAPLYTTPVIELGRTELNLAMEREKFERIDLSDNDDPLGKVLRVQSYLHAAAEQSTGENKDIIETQAAYVDMYLDRQNSPSELAKIEEMRRTAVEGYYVPARTAYPELDDQAEDYRRKVNELANANRDEANALHYIAGYAEDIDNRERQLNIPSLEKAKEALEEARAVLATIHAKRQKTVYGFDFNSKTASLGNKNLETIRAQNNYNHRLQMMIAAEMAAKVADEGKFANEDAANKFLAERIAEEGNALEEKTIEQYTNNNTRLGKVINFLGGRKPNGEKDPSKMKTALRYTLIAAGAGVTVAAAATGGALAAGIVGGAITTAKTFAIFESRGRYNRIQKKRGLLNKEDLIEELNDLDKLYKEDQQNTLIADEDKSTEAEHFNEKMLFVGRFLESAAEKETRRQKLHVAKRLGAAAVVGVGAKLGIHYLADYMFGADEAVAAAQNGTPKEVKMPNEGWWAQSDAPAAEVPTGDGNLDDIPTMPGQDAPAPSPDVSPTGSEIPTTMELPDGTTVEVPAEYATTEAYTGPGSVYVQPGGGYFDIFKQMGIPEDQWGTVLSRVGPALIEHGDAMRLPSSMGTYGVGRPGYISKFALDAIQYAANMR